MVQSRIAEFSGLPLVTEEHLRARIKELASGGRESAVRYLQNNLARIKDTNPFYSTFIEDASMVYGNDCDIAEAELAFGYVLLESAGNLPKLEQQVLEGRWNATMARELCLFNIGTNMDFIKTDNPVYYNSIMRSCQYFAPAPQGSPLLAPDHKVWIMSDLSSGYMILCDQIWSDKRKNSSTLPQDIVKLPRGR